MTVARIRTPMNINATATEVDAPIIYDLYYTHYTYHYKVYVDLKVAIKKALHLKSHLHHLRYSRIIPYPVLCYNFYTTDVGRYDPKSYFLPSEYG